MKHSRIQWITLLVMLAAIMTLGACKKKQQAAPPQPPAPPPPSPTASLTADPSTIQKGQSTTLTWQTSNATDVTIEGLGAVQPNGSKSISPTDSTTYRLLAKGPGGTQDATARVTITQPPAPPVAPPSPSDEQQFSSMVKDIYFDYDRYDLRPDQTAILQSDAQWLAAHPNVRFTVEGHCDERGSTEYNIVLGQNRAEAARNGLAQAGVPADRMKTVSYGKEKPVCTDATEQCWQQNRRVHFTYGQQ